MRKLLLLTAGIVLLVQGVAHAQIAGPARRAAAAAGDAVGAPGIGDRIENREERRDAARSDVNPNAAARQAERAGAIPASDRWRYVQHNNGWWYYTPQHKWMYYRDNRWTAYDPATYVPAQRGRYQMGYRGNRFDNRVYNRRPQAAVPYSNGTRAGNAGADLGAGIGAAAGNPARGAAVGGAIGNAVGDLNPAAQPAPAAPPAPVAPAVPGPAGPDPIEGPRP